MALTISEIVDFVDNWKSANNINGDLNSSQLSKFISDVQSEIAKMDFTMANDTILFSPYVCRMIL